MEQVMLLGFLSICALEDLLKKQMHLFYIIGFALLGIGIQIYEGRLELEKILLASLLGVVVCILGKFSDERVGIGDGAMLITTGIYLGFWENTLVFWLASMGAALVGMLLYIIFRKPSYYRIPFAPFLLGAYLLVLMIGEGGIV